MMKKLLFLLFLFPLCANAQWLPTSVSFQKPNPIVNSKDSVRYIYPGKLDYSYWYNAEFIRANYVNNSSSVHVASGALTVGPFVSVSAPPSRIYANSFTTAPTTDDLTNSIVIGVGNVSAVNNRLGQIGFVSGDVDFTAPKMVAYIQGVATETYAGNTAVGSKMLFFTGTNGGTTPVQRMQIDNLGNVNISGLSNSLPVKTDASKNLISGAIALAGSDVSGVLTGSNGGTGVSNSGKTITLGSSLTTVGAFASTFTMTGTTSVTFPQSGTLATTTTFAGANPTATAGTTAVNGVATTFMRSDAAPKVDTTTTGFVTKAGLSTSGSAYFGNLKAGNTWAQAAIFDGGFAITHGSGMSLYNTSNTFFSVLNVSAGFTANRNLYIPDETGTILAAGAKGQIALTSGVSTIAVSGVTTSSKAFVSFVSIGGTVSTTWQYKAVCTSGTVTITAITNAGTTNTADTSTLNYFVTQ